MSLALPQALMVIGRMGDGLEDFCTRLAQAHITGGDARNAQLIAAGTHPDLHLLGLEETTTGKKKKNILIGQVRQMIEATNMSPVIAHTRLSVIVPACRMNASAANALLKSLEEPNPKLRFILGCENPGWLPATVMSRCQRLLLPRPTREQALQWLEGKKAKDAQLLLDLAGGAPLDAMQSQQLLKAHRELERICSGKKLLSGRSVLDSAEIGDWLPWAIGWAVDGTRSAMGLGAQSAVAREINGRSSPSALMWLDLHSELIELMKVANHPANKRLVLERVAWNFSRLS